MTILVVIAIFSYAMGQSPLKITLSSYVKATSFDANRDIHQFLPVLFDDVLRPESTNALDYFILSLKYCTI